MGISSCCHRLGHKNIVVCSYESDQQSEWIAALNEAVNFQFPNGLREAIVIPELVSAHGCQPASTVPSCGRDQEALDNEARDADTVLHHPLESAPGSEISRSPQLRGHTELSNFPKTTSTESWSVREFPDNYPMGYSKSKAFIPIFQ